MKSQIHSLALVLPWVLALSVAAAAESLGPSTRVIAEGRVAPYPGAEVTLALDLAGTLEGVSVEEKQVVRKGSVVARLRVDDLKAALAEAKARIARMRSRMPASSASHSARRAGVDSTADTMAPPWIGGLE